VSAKVNCLTECCPELVALSVKARLPRVAAVATQAAVVDYFLAVAARVRAAADQESLTGSRKDWQTLAVANLVAAHRLHHVVVQHLSSKRQVAVSHLRVAVDRVCWTK
jgi:hypothetical protein